MLELLTLFAMMVLQVIVPPIPAEALVIAAGKFYGIGATTLVASAGLWIGSVIVYHIGKEIRKKYERFFDKNKVKKVVTKIRKYDSAILWIRILPYNPSDVISYAAGIMHIEKKKFYAITAITSVVRCATLATLGSILESVGSIVFVVILLGVSAILQAPLPIKIKHHALNCVPKW